ncbi:MAG: MurR/RpiR family transcriptional regulator [Clostridia bacterium]|nr:MurR/RpiR family transcriptional regulator [Clostridia bacterium]
MESTLHKIRFEYKKLGPSEKKIADYILKNGRKVTSLSISELAKLSGSTAATIVRFSRKLGFEGFTDLRIGLASEMISTSTISTTINKTDSCFEIFNKRINDISVSLWNTESVLDPKQLDLAANKIMKAQRIVIFGLGNSAAIAQDAAHKFLRLGLSAQACCDNHMQAIIASHLDRQSVAIAVSHSGESTDIIDALQLSKIGNATTICITNYADSPIVENCDICLFTKSDETNHSILAMSSRIAQLAIFDAIYTYIVLNADKASINAIYNTETALKSKKTKR